MMPFNSAHQIGLSTSSQGVFMTSGGFGVVYLKKQRNKSYFIRAILRYISTRVAMMEWMIPLDSAHQIGLFTCWKMDDTIVFSASNRCIYPLEEVFDYR